MLHLPFLSAFALAIEGFSVATLIIELIICILFVILLFLFRPRFLKIICACGAEVCLWLACKMSFGPDAIITQIFTWITAAAAIIMMIAIVNRIDWSDLRGKKH
ncbi:MAG: hypothetical protein E7645_03175 [Ruminococcaceae bacterium]|nr:hypothetical protein [Oscillospiraceae bacterium]